MTFESTNGKYNGIYLELDAEELRRCWEKANSELENNLRDDKNWMNYMRAVDERRCRPAEIIITS